MRHAPKETPKPLYSGMPPATFDLQAPFAPAGDQPRAIEELTDHALLF